MVPSIVALQRIQHRKAAQVPSSQPTKAASEIDKKGVARGSHPPMPAQDAKRISLRFL